MGYRCPVCGADQADGVHLANHLAVTASLGREDHRAWLAEHAPDWADRGPEELSSIVTDHAAEIETPDFESNAAGGAPRLEDAVAEQARSPGRGTSDETARVLSEAREMTRRMYDDEPAGSGDERGDRSSNGADDGSPTDADGGVTGDADEPATEDENG